MSKNDEYIEFFKNLSTEEKNKAQARLDKLCKKHKLKTWKIDSTRGKWKDLIFNILDLPVVEDRKSGRPIVWDKDFKEYIIRTMIIMDEFPYIEDDKEIYRKTSLEEKIKLVVKGLKITAATTKDSNKFVPAEKRVEALWKKKKKIQKIIKKDEEEAQKKDRCKDLPTEYYKNLEKNNTRKNKKRTK